MSLMVIMTLGVASATTIVTGKVYNSDFSQEISGVSITVYCDSSSLSTDTSLSDGAYSVVFSANCTSVKVNAVKSSLTGEMSGNVHKCNGLECAQDYIAVINPSISAPAVVPSNNNGGNGGSSGGGGSTGLYYKCGNGICDSGENSNTCSKDCPVIDLSGEEDNNEEISNESIDSNNNRGITGAVIGAVTSTGGLVTIIVLVLLGGTGFFLARKKRLAKK